MNFSYIYITKLACTLFNCVNFINLTRFKKLPIVVETNNNV